LVVASANSSAVLLTVRRKFENVRPQHLRKTLNNHIACWAAGSLSWTLTMTPKIWPSCSFRTLPSNWQENASSKYNDDIKKHLFAVLTMNYLCWRVNTDIYVFCQNLDLRLEDYLDTCFKKTVRYLENIYCKGIYSLSEAALRQYSQNQSPGSSISGFSKDDIFILDMLI
jgi:hypothetical protein